MSIKFQTYTCMPKVHSKTVRFSFGNTVPFSIPTFRIWSKSSLGTYLTFIEKRSVGYTPE